MKRLVVVSYAINGRGIGHLTRQLAILRWMRRYAGAAGVKLEAWVLTSSEADTLARREGVPALKMPSKAMLRDAGIEPTRMLAVARGWVLNAITGLRPDLLLVDTFPGGSFGELLPVLETVPVRALVARPVRDEIAAGDAYRALLPLYQRVYVPDEHGGRPILLREREELLSREAARAALGIPGDRRAIYVSLGGGGDPTAAGTLPRLIEALRPQAHLVVGGGPLYQGPEIRGPGVTWLDRYAAMELLPGVDAAVSAGGYNSFHELMFVGVPTVFLPQDKIADDQQARVASAVRAGAGRVAPTVDDVPRLVGEPGSAEAARALVPENGASRAAAELLALVLDPADVEAAARAWPRSLLASRVANGLAPERLLEVVRLYAGDAPSAHRARLQAFEALVERGDIDGAAPPPRAMGPVGAVFAALDAWDAPPDLAAQVALALPRRFPTAPPAAWAEGLAALLPCFARFRDPAGALALLRAIPAQRQVDPAQACARIAEWLATEEDLFDAQRAYARAEDLGTRPLTEVLHRLTHRARAEDEGALLGGGRR